MAERELRKRAMTTVETWDRRRHLAIRTMRMTEEMPRGSAGEIPASPIVRSAISVAANYHSACRARSWADQPVEKGTDETGRGRESIAAVAVRSAAKRVNRQRESDEMTAVVVRSIKNIRSGARTPPSSVAIPPEP
jgi:four helix bundle protein